MIHFSFPVFIFRISYFRMFDAFFVGPVTGVKLTFLKCKRWDIPFLKRLVIHSFINRLFKLLYVQGVYQQQPDQITKLDVLWKYITNFRHDTEPCGTASTLNCIAIHTAQQYVHNTLENIDPTIEDSYRRESLLDISDTIKEFHSMTYQMTCFSILQAKEVGKI